LREPVLQLLASGGGDAIDVFVGPIFLLDLAFGDEPVADEPVEHLIEVADVEVAPLRPDGLPELRSQLVAVRLTTFEQRVGLTNSSAALAERLAR
jgi:hypothetical protein